MRNSTLLLGRILMGIASETLDILTKILNIQQKSPCPPCVPWITKISGSPTYKKKRRYSHTTSSAQKNPYLIYFCSCKYTNKTDTIQIFPYIFLFLFVKIKLFLPQATKKNPRNTRRTQILVKDFVQDSSYDVEP